DEPAPSAHADQLAEVVVAEQPGEHVAARAGQPVDEHALGALVAVRRPWPVLAIAPGPIVGARAVEQFDEARGDLPASVPSLVDDQGLLADLPVELAEELVLPVDAGVGHVDVADLAAGRLVHV